MNVFKFKKEHFKRVCEKANSMKGVTQKEAFTAAWAAVKFEIVSELLRKYKVLFTFVKANGEIRQAYGSNHRQDAYQFVGTKGTGQKGVEKKNFLDLELLASGESEDKCWRSVSKGAVKEIIGFN